MSTKSTSPKNAPAVKQDKSEKAVKPVKAMSSVTNDLPLTPPTPSQVDSIQWTGSNTDDVVKFSIKKTEDGDIEKVRPIEENPDRLSVETIYGFVQAQKGDHINKDSNGNLTLVNDEQHKAEKKAK
jgi:hypothetical protein